MGDSERNTDECGCKDADEHASPDLENYQYCGKEKADCEEDAVGACEVSESYERSVVVYDDAGVLEADECDVEADTCSDSLLESVRNSFHDEVADLGHGQDDEDDTFKQDGREGELPAVPK